MPFVKQRGCREPARAEPTAARTPLPCVHEGHTCAPPADKAGDGRTYLHCDILGTVCRCNCGPPPTCNSYEADDPDAAPEPPAPKVEPLALTEVGPAGLSKGRSGWAFNAGLIRFKGRLLLTYRTDWAGAHCHVAELNEDYGVRRTVALPHLAHPAASFGREDPRPFVFRGKLHVWYVGVAGTSGPTNMLYARLSDSLQVEEVFAPEFFGRRSWEKNWSPFEWAGELFAVYSIAPHVVLHIRGNQAYPFAETDTPFPWAGGHLRGGASPVRVGDQFYHWFHGRKDQGWVYNVGLYTFEARPPFRVTRMTPAPLLEGDPKDTDGNYCPVTFPCGSVLEAGGWKVGMGWNDRKVMVGEWDAAAVERALAPPGTDAKPPFVILSYPRTGSHLLAELLHTSGLPCTGEVLHPDGEQERGLALAPPGDPAMGPPAAGGCVLQSGDYVSSHHATWERLVRGRNLPVVALTRTDLGAAWASHHYAGLAGRHVIAGAVDPDRPAERTLPSAVPFARTILAVEAGRRRLYPANPRLAVTYEELTADPAGTLARVRAFLGVGPGVSPSPRGRKVPVDYRTHFANYAEVMAAARRELPAHAHRFPG